MALLLVIVGLVPTAFGLGAGRGFGIHSLVFMCFEFFVVFALLGALFGAVIGLIKSLIRRAGEKSRVGGWWAVANRPIRLFPGRGAESPPTGETPTQVESTPGRTRIRRWAWLIGVTVLVLLATAFVVGTFAGRFVDRRLAEAIAEANQDTPHWRLDDLMADREPIPDEENSAIVVAEAVSMLPPNWPGSPRNLPNLPTPAPTKAMLAFDRLGETPSNVRLDDETAATFREELDTYQDAVTTARTVADFRHGRHEIRLLPNLIAIPLRETQETRVVSRLLTADAAIRAHDGDINGALDSCRANLGVGRSIGDEPFLISGLVRVAIGTVAMDSARRVLAQGEPSDAALARLQALVLDELSQPLQLQEIRGERGMMDEMIRRIRDADISLSSLSGDRSADDPIPPISPWGKLAFDHQRAVGLEWMNELVNIARRPPFERPPLRKALESRIEHMTKTWYGPYVATLPLLMMPALSMVDIAQTRYQGLLGATAILLAAERHRLQTGDWPESIAAIDPAILPHPPVDPFSGRPFHIKRANGQFLVYSVGPNLEDENGAFEPRRRMKEGLDDVGNRGWDLPLRGATAQESNQD